MSLLIGLILLSTNVLSQKKQIDFVDFLYECITNKQSIDPSDYTGYLDELGIIEGYTLEEAEIVLGDLNWTDLTFDEEGKEGYVKYTLEHPILRALKKKHPDAPIEINEEGRLIIRNNILLYEVSFEYFDFENLHIEGLLGIIDYSDWKDEDYIAYILNCDIDYLYLQNDQELPAKKPELYINDNTLNKLFLGGPLGRMVFVDDNKINRFIGRSVHADNFSIHYNTFFGIEEELVQLDSNFLDHFSKNQHIVRIRSAKSEIFHFGHNEVNGSNESLVSFQVTSDELNFHDNKIKGSLLINYSKAADRFYFTNTKVSGVVGIHELIFSETYNAVDWNDLDGKLVSLSTEAALERFQDEFPYDFSAMQTTKQLQDTTASDQLIRTYYNLYRIYKENGNLRYANSSYSQMKDLETNRLKYFYEESGSMKSWFRWKLGQLLKFYTDNGTDPARSLQVSAYLILIFAVFYMFFPSDWDTKSKKQLVDNLKAFFDKSVKTTRMSVLVIFSALTMTILNAITLSINSFVTLGFGKIPTYGLARYVCIIQGFLGWFLLSLFTVALINQVLF